MSWGGARMGSQPASIAAECSTVGIDVRPVLGDFWRIHPEIKLVASTYVGPPQAPNGGLSPQGKGF
jgi:hypothetical protein